MRPISCIYYTHNDIPEGLHRRTVSALARATVWHAANRGPVQMLCIMSEHVDWFPAEWAQHIAIGNHGLHDCYTKILAGLELCENETVYLLEHDVMYPPEYFDFVPYPDKAGFWYNRNVYRQNAHGVFPHRRGLTSNCCARRELLLQSFRWRMDFIAGGGRIKWDEPGWMPDEEGGPQLSFSSHFPVIDIRWGGNLTGMRYAADQSGYETHLPHWGDVGSLWSTYQLTPGMGG